MEYSYNRSTLPPNSLFSAYMPGTYTGVGNDGVFRNPITGEDETVRRNFYSTKFVQVNSFVSRGPWEQSTTNFPIYSEGDIRGNETSDGAQKLYRNPLDASSIGADLNAIRY
jgi:hypothetical protein